MSDPESAEEFGSAKDETFDKSGNSGEDSEDDKPLFKAKKKSTKSPKKKGTKPQKQETKVKRKAGRPPKTDKKPVVKAEPKVTRRAGRPRKTDKQAKVSFSDDPLAGAEPDESDVSEEQNEVSEEEESDVSEEEYEVNKRHFFAITAKNNLKLFFFR